MSEGLIDDVLVKAIEQAAKEAGQDSRTAKRLLRWMEAIASKELTAEEHSEFLNVVKDSISIGAAK